MTKPMMKIHNVTTGEVSEREMTDQEIAQMESDAVASQLQMEAEAAKATEKAALLAKLGITEEEAALLLGGN
jgi:hypothetical protein